MFRILLSVVLCLLIPAFGAAAYFGLASLKEPPAEREIVEKVYNVEVFDVEPADLREIISAFGSAEADRQVTLSAMVAGEIVEVHPRLEIGEAVAGDRVFVGRSGQSERRSGDRLLRIDPEPYRARIEQAVNRIAEDRAELRRLAQEERNNERLLQKARGDYDTYLKEHQRTEDLYKKGVETASNYTKSLLELRRFEEALLKYENAAALFPEQRAQIQKRLESHETDKYLAELDLQYTEVKPPFSGILDAVNVEVGQYVRPGDPLVSLTDLSEVRVPVALPLDDYAKIGPQIRAGRQPLVRLAENETAPPRWTGYIASISPQADQLTRTVDAYVHVDNAAQDVPLLPGTFVHARIEGPILEHSILVPRDAITDGKLFVAVEGRVEERPAGVVRTLRSMAVIKDSLQPGDQVILTNLDVIYEGAQVAVQSHRTLQAELEQQRIPVARRTSFAHDGSQSKPSVN